MKINSSLEYKNDLSFSTRMSVNRSELNNKFNITPNSVQHKNTTKHYLNTTTNDYSQQDERTPSSINNTLQ